MAGQVKLQREIDAFRKEYADAHSRAEAVRPEEHRAAVRVQSWFRGWQVRASISHLLKQAVIIQRIWRGFRARAHFRQMVKAAYFIMKMNFYEEMAVKIQKSWRGFYVRKYIHNFYARKKYLDGVARKNELFRREMETFEEIHRREQENSQMMEEQKRRAYQAHRLHHLLSTKQRPGIFNPPSRAVPYEMERLLRQVKYHTPSSAAHGAPTSRLRLPGSPAPAGPGTLGSSLLAGTRSFSRPILPPIVGKEKPARP